MGFRLFLVAFWSRFLPSVILFGGAAIGGYLAQQYLIASRPHDAIDPLPGWAFALLGFAGILIHGLWTYHKNRELIASVMRADREGR
jgi:hypothetical protein